MNTTTISIPKPFTTISAHIPSTTPRYRHLRPPAIVPIKCKSSSDNTTTTASNSSDNASPIVPPPPVTPPDGVEIRFRRGVRRKSRQQQQDGVTNGLPKKAEPKDWESMTLTEKAVELYVGEKGLLFWLNKLAYASIFVIIGAWILFRFVGPALNLYQLDSAPISPTSIFKGS
ncbi:Monofunctional biosynthetic peptidoglycan transglycosylase [Actinidia chinensis var. chinensis]|uniref:Monofunctional biosynthetic peptidoglycan transglycosylase n=1 Tax=Actinidia chinensis var. chinensis TaxID=1590841 RepID=A0A2R6R5U5_ACTCC|nr:Monofunctional biosynthetic peptidoglycan transglycosylase [Actinidia chinensis var. chinensis]